MKPKSQETSGQIDLFNKPLADLLNPKHELYQLTHLIDWKVLYDAFGEFFTENQGAPALPTRLIAGLHYLKHAFARSDEAVVAQWLENPYRRVPRAQVSMTLLKMGVWPLEVGLQGAGFKPPDAAAIQKTR